MTNDLKTAESRAADIIVSNAVKAKTMPKAVKAKISKRKTKETEAVEEPPPNEYMIKVNERREKNNERINTISKGMKKRSTRLKSQLERLH